MNVFRHLRIKIVEQALSGREECLRKGETILNRKVASLLLPGVVLAGLGVYILSAITRVPLGTKGLLLFLLAIGPLGIVGCLELGRFLDPESHTLLFPCRYGFRRMCLCDLGSGHGDSEGNCRSSEPSNSK